MELTDLCIESLWTLAANKMRTALAILGIVIGIGSVIALISLGKASQLSIQAQIQSLGANLLTVIPGSSRTGAVRGALGGGTTVTRDDALAIMKNADQFSIQSVSPELTRRFQISTSSNNTNTQVIGVTDAYAHVHSVVLSSGNFISQNDNDSMTKVAVIGPQVFLDLFGEGNDPIGQTVRVNNLTFTVIGVTEPKGGTGFQNQDDVVYVPLSTAQKQLVGVDYLSSIAIEAKSQAVMQQTQDDIGYFLLSKHGLNDPAQADFSIFSQQDILNTASAATNTFTALLSGIAAISLLVGGIGIMNIMLVTVTERTREIGLRKALGARNKTIIVQFLMESVMLTIIGGLIGVLLGIFISFVISKLINSPFVISFSSILLSCVASTIIGIVFGWYPANRAAHLQPIEALRYE